MYQFIVCGKNVALGSFPDMRTAMQSVMKSDPHALQLEGGECYATYWSPSQREVLTIVAVKPSTEAGPMF